MAITFNVFACSERTPLEAPTGEKLSDLLADGEITSQLALTAAPDPASSPGAPATPPGSNVPGGPGGPIGGPIGSGGAGGTTGIGGTGGVSGTGGFFGTGGIATGTGGRGFGGTGGVFGTGGFFPSDAGPPIDTGPLPPCDPSSPFPTPLPPPGSDGGVPFPGGACRQVPLARWELDDCNTFRTELRDDRNGFTAYRTVGAACTEGREGQGVSLPRESDLVYVPDQPQFTFAKGVTIAAWVKTDRLTGSRTIFRKRDGLLTSSVALMTVGKNFAFIISRSGALPAAVFAPAPAGRFVHVAATYDGSYLRLYLDGVEAASQYATGIISDGEGPLLFGNDILQRRFEGTLDKLWFDTEASPPEVINTLLCVRGAPQLAVTPARSAPVPPEGSTQFVARVTNTSSPQCAAETYFVGGSGPFQSVAVSGGGDVQVRGGQSGEITFTATSNEDTEPGEFPLSFFAFDRFKGGVAEAQAIFVAAEDTGTGCRVRNGRELLVRHPSVVDDPLRSEVRPENASDPESGVWTFKHLMEQAAPSAAAAADMTEGLFRTFLSRQNVNGFILEPRLGFDRVLSTWPRDGEGKLDLARAPMRLLAIVNRVDLRNLDEGHAGEGRFVFGIIDPTLGFPFEATVIFEYMLPGTTEADVLKWANDFHALGRLPFPSADYNRALSSVVKGFTARGAAPGRINGTALLRVRTNEIAFGNGIWELREFGFDAQGILRPDTIKLTPDMSWNNTSELADFINANEAAIEREEFDVPRLLPGSNRPFLGGAVFNDFFINPWNAPGIRSAEARHKFALNTCNGCHAFFETQTSFLMIGPRSAGQESFLSPFLTGTTVRDVVSGQERRLDDLERRNIDLRFLVCPEGEKPDNRPQPPPTGGLPGPVPPQDPVPPGSGGVSGAGGTGGGPRPPFPGPTFDAGPPVRDGGIVDPPKPPSMNPPAPTPPTTPPAPSAPSSFRLLAPDTHVPATPATPTIRRGIRRVH